MILFFTQIYHQIEKDPGEKFYLNKLKIDRFNHLNIKKRIIQLKSYFIYMDLIKLYKEI